MDKSKLPHMVPGKVVPTPKSPIPKAKRRPKKTGGPRGGVGAVLDIIKERKRRMKEALDL